MRICAKILRRTVKLKTVHCCAFQVFANTRTRPVRESHICIQDAFFLVFCAIFYLIVALCTHEPNAHEPGVSGRCVHLEIGQLYKGVFILYTLRSVRRKNAFCVNDPLNNIIYKSIAGDFCV